MRCENFEKQIVLWPELNADERGELEKHLGSCASCKTYFESTALTRDKIHEVGGIKPMLADPNRMTTDIMKRIVTGNKQILVIHSQTLQLARYALAAVSVFFVFFLGIELLPFAEQPQEQTQVVSRSIVLDKGKFKEALRKSRSSNLRSMKECVGPFNLNKVDEACLREKLAWSKVF